MSERSVEILCIGREILDGRVLDTNSNTIALEIAKVGLRPQYAQKVDDDSERVREAFRIAKSRAEVVLVSGGLGPTSDDRTLEIFAEFVGEDFIQYGQAVEHLESYLRERNRPTNEAQLKQSYFPAGGAILPNPFGTACGFTYDAEGTKWFFMPGPPRELQPMLEKEILPKLGQSQKLLGRAWITQFTAESDLQLMLNAVIKKLPADWDLSFQARFPEVAIALHAPIDADQALFQKFSREIREVVQLQSWYEGDHSRRQIEEELVAQAKESQTLLVSVESCTGGLIAERITDVPGSSAVFVSAWVTYANEAKIALGVDEKIIAQEGAVSESCARAMAEAGLKQARKSFPKRRVLCMAATGIAGPDGGSSEKPVGMSYVALADSDGPLRVERVQALAKLGRNQNRRFFSQKALAFALDRLQKRSID